MNGFTHPTGFRLDQCLQDQRERVADDIQIATGAQCI
jgi:hypothetical protein